MGMNSEMAWKVTLGELELQMAKSTFNQLLRGAELLGIQDGAAVIGVRNEYACEWLEKRLKDTVERTFAVIIEHPIAVEFVVKSDEAAVVPIRSNGHANGRVLKGEPPPPPNFDPSDEGPPRRTNINQADDPPPGNGDESWRMHVPDFEGCEPITGNFTTAPDRFFDYIMVNEHCGVIKIVGQVVRKTVGTFADKRHMRRVEEWAVNNTVLMSAAGISSRTTLLTSLWDARYNGYIILREPDEEEAARLSEEYGYPVNALLRIRFAGDTPDIPVEERPSYGNARAKAKC